MFQLPTASETWFRYNLPTDTYKCSHISICSEKLLTHTKNTTQYISSLYFVKYRLDRGSIPGRDKRDFSVLHCVPTGCGTQPISYSVGNMGFLPPRLKRSGHEGDHLPHLVPILRICGGYLHSPRCLYYVYRHNFAFTSTLK